MNEKQGRFISPEAKEMQKAGRKIFLPAFLCRLRLFCRLCFGFTSELFHACLSPVSGRSLPGPETLSDTIPPFQTIYLNLNSAVFLQLANRRF
ncbi:MAG: hypothetical protein IJ930_03750 [Lachnospiraceae bacterium]|nr:hypothetical protein [Lachnospiraceae bacterium]